MTGLARRVPAGIRLAVLLFGLANLAFLLRFADRDGYEGDDINSVVPIAHLEAAKAGALLVYRYAWQPLSYELSGLIWSAFGTPTAVFLSAAAGGACTLALLLYWLWREGQGRAGALACALLALLAIPELWYSSLYYNTTIRALPLIVVALLLLREGERRWQAILAGVLTGLAILMRLDFILICPLLALAAWPRGGSLWQPVLLAVAVVATLLAGYAAGLVDLSEIQRINAFNGWEIAKNADLPGWDRRLKLGVLSVALSPVGWLLLIGGAALLLRDAWRRRDWRALAWAAAALPPLLPVPNMLSPKYLLPMAPFALLLFVRAQEVYARGRGLLWAAAILPWLFSISLYGGKPYVAPGLLASRPVPTHDGPRAWGGYVWQMMDTDNQAGREQALAGEAMARALLARPGENIVYLGSEDYFEPGGLGWRNLQLALQQRGLHGTLVAPHVLRFDLPNGHWLLLARTLPAGLEEARYRVIDAHVVPVEKSPPTP